MWALSTDATILYTIYHSLNVRDLCPNSGCYARNGQPSRGRSSWPTRISRDLLAGKEGACSRMDGRGKEKKARINYRSSLPRTIKREKEDEDQGYIGSK